MQYFYLFFCKEKQNKIRFEPVKGLFPRLIPLCLEMPKIRDVSRVRPRQLIYARIAEAQIA